MLDKNAAVFSPLWEICVPGLPLGQKGRWGQVPAGTHVVVRAAPAAATT